MNHVYLITPFLTWFVTGVLKFLINSMKQRRLAFDLMGYGGMPSNHSAIVSSVVTLVFLREGVDSPAFGVSLAFAFVVLLDANSLRGQVGKHASVINKLSGATLRERMGHSKIEIFAGVIVGILTAKLAHFIFC